MPNILHKGQINAEVIYDIPASRTMRRGRPHLALVVLRPHDGLQEELALAYYEADRLGRIDEGSVRLIRFDRAGAARLPRLLEKAAEIARMWGQPEKTIEAWI